MSILEKQEDFRLRCMQKRIEEFSEMRRNGKRTMRVRLEEVERIMIENYSLHLTVRQMSQRLNDMSELFVQAMPIIGKAGSK